eukprot:m.38713 g.38713  ORF g.38713 m.38713 type:complete len:327 (-) comp9464_c0_seq2:21-1001(-)
MTTLIIGASGAIGQALAKALALQKRKVVVCVHRTEIQPINEYMIVQRGVDVTNEDSLERAIRPFKSELKCVWNLAAPLSVDTAKNPAKARDITVNGMSRLLRVLEERLRITGCVVCFSDSIGSYGKGSPRKHATGRWLVQNPTHDPGSDYGIQKRECRELLRLATERGKLETRFAVIPGVLHDDNSWGAGTTEYVLDAIAAARKGTPYICPVALDTILPMIDRRDLIRGLIALQDAPSSCIREPQGGYSIAGYALTARAVLHDLQEKFPGFKYKVKADGPAALFAELWCDTLSPTEAERDFNFKSRYNWSHTLTAILSQHTPKAHL